MLATVAISFILSFSLYALCAVHIVQPTSFDLHIK